MGTKFGTALLGFREGGSVAELGEAAAGTAGETGGAVARRRWSAWKGREWWG